MAVDPARRCRFHTADLNSHDLDEFIAAAGRLAGSESYQVGSVSRSYYVAAGAEAWETVWVLAFDNGKIVTVSITDYET